MVSFQVLKKIGRGRPRILEDAEGRTDDATEVTHHACRFPFSMFSAVFLYCASVTQAATQRQGYFIMPPKGTPGSSAGSASGAY